MVDAGEEDMPEEERGKPAVEWADFGMEHGIAGQNQFLVDAPRVRRRVTSSGSETIL
jgi:hypothetical protein